MSATTPRLLLAAFAAAVLLSPVAARAQAPAAVTDLRFEEFFRFPVGSRGLEFTDKLKGLNGKRVRLTGQMVNHVHANPRVFLLSPVALKFHQCEYGLCDDLPATAVHVHVPGNPRERVPWTPGEVVLTGRLSVGNVEELDGRVSTVRLFLDAPPPAAPPAATAAVTAAAR